MTRCFQMTYPFNRKHVNNTLRLIMHRLIARAIGRDPSLVDKVRGTLQGVDDDWNAILALPVPEVRRLLTSRSENMIRLRLSSPFAFVIDFTNVDLRRRIHRAARRPVEHSDRVAALAACEPSLHASVLSQWMNYSKRSTLRCQHYVVMPVAITASTANLVTSTRMVPATCSAS
jgi:hypothetical protein